MICCFLAALITLLRGWLWPTQRSNRSLGCAQIQAKRISPSPSICIGVISITHHARKELKLAQKSLPNEPWVFQLTSYIDRRQGRWAESIKNLEHAIELDPQNRGFLKQLADTYRLCASYADAKSASWTA